MDCHHFLTTNNLYTMCVWTHLFKFLCQQLINNSYPEPPDDEKEKKYNKNILCKGTEDLASQQV